LKREIIKEELKPNVEKLDNDSDIITFLKREAIKEYVAHPRVRK